MPQYGVDGVVIVVGVVSDQQSGGFRVGGWKACFPWASQVGGSYCFWSRSEIAPHLPGSAGGRAGALPSYSFDMSGSMCLIVIEERVNGEMKGGYGLSSLLSGGFLGKGPERGLF